MNTFILPAAGWAILLDGIMASVQPGDVLRCGTVEMYLLALEAVKAAGREDIRVELEQRKEHAL